MENCASLKCFYAILGVEKNSSSTEIRTAYRKLAMRWHPDRCLMAKDDAREQAKLKFQVVQEAYAVLSDQNKRLIYDAGLHEEVERDPSMQDFMGELVNMMNGQSSVSTKKSNTDHEFEELRKMFMNIVDTDNYVRDCQQFDVNLRTPEREQLKKAKSRSPPANTYDQIFPFSCTPDPSQKLSSVQRPFESHSQLHSANNNSNCQNLPFSGPSSDSSQNTSTVHCQSPRPHHNLYMATHCPEFDFDCDSFDHTSRRVASEYEQPSLSCPEPHANLYPEERHYFDFMSVSSTPNFEQPGQGFSRLNFPPSRPAEFPTTIDVSACAPSNLSAEGFCMGVSGDGPVRGHVRHAKSRRRRCNDKV